MKSKKYITRLIRGFLLVALVYFVIDYVVFDGKSYDSSWMSNTNGELLFVVLLSFVLTFTFDYLEKRHKIFIPHVIASTSIIFIFSSLFLGTVADFYTRFWWWDNLLHLISSVLLGLIGFLLIYYLNSRYSMHLSPVFVALFVLTFAVFMGVVWELFEFTRDALVGSNMQCWVETDSDNWIGKDYQGSGLRDTMADLIVDMIGGFVAATYAYILYTHRQDKALKMMRGTFENTDQSR